jgi:nicotinamidase-related amidase
MWVVVVDPQEGWARRGARPTLQRLARFLEREKAWSATVITCFANGERSPFRQNLAHWTGFQTEEERRLVEALDTARAPVFWRDTYGLPEELWRYLEEQGTEEVLLTGVETDASVLSAAMAAFDRGLSVWVTPALVASTYGRRGQLCGLAVLRKVLGGDRVVSLADAAARLRDGARARVRWDGTP